MNKKTPHRRIEAEIFIGADSWDDLAEMIDALDREIQDAKKADENLYWVNPAKNASADVSITVDSTMTAAQYRERLKQWKINPPSHEELAAGLSALAADLNTLMKNAVGAGLRIFLETKSLPPGPYPQINIRTYKPPAAITWKEQGHDEKP